MTTVRAKFTCSEVTIRLDGYNKRRLYTYHFYPVTSGSPENEKFYAYTPSGKLELASIREDLFEIGQVYYLDFSPEVLGNNA